MSNIVWNPPKASDSDIERWLGDHAGLAGVDRTRMGRLLCDQLVHGIVTRTLDAFAVTDVLQALEVPGRARCNVERGPFRKPPLRGLMHAHFFQASFIARNLQNELQRKDSLRLFEEALGIRGVLDGAALNRVAHAATFGMYENRASRKAITGEWLIYAEHEEQRFYFAVAGHDEGDENIFSRIMERSEQRFRDVLDAVTRKPAT